jgi:putative Holliday junction resolvase
MNEKTNSQFFDKKHLLAIDYGEKFTGLATQRVNTDPIIIPYGRIKFQDQKQLIKEIQKILDEEFIDVLILGVPYFTDGTESTNTKHIKKFGNLLSKSVTIPVYFQDETLSSYEAQDRMKNSPRYNFKVDMKQIDAVAATIILEDFLKASTLYSSNE